MTVWAARAGCTRCCLALLVSTSTLRFTFSACPRGLGKGAESNSNTLLPTCSFSFRRSRSSWWEAAWKIWPLRGPAPLAGASSSLSSLSSSLFSLSSSSALSSLSSWSSAGTSGSGSALRFFDCLAAGCLAAGCLAAGCSLSLLSFPSSLPSTSSFWAACACRSSTDCRAYPIAIVSCITSRKLQHVKREQNLQQQLAGPSCFVL